ncbi:MAG: hypothetical protein WC591_14715 [Microbacterium sp.]
MILPPIDPDTPFSEGDDFDGVSPRCPECLATMEPHQGARGEHWKCPQCGAVKLS